MAPSQRWDLDDRGIGAGNAGAWRPLIDELAELSETEGWVAEEPEAHLLPHITAATSTGPLAIRSSSLLDDGTFEVELEWTGRPEPTRLDVRTALFGVLATVAETLTLVHEPAEAGGRVVEVVTGARTGGPFATHGHTLRLHVVGVDRPASATPE
jgi:hypothetical protein